MNKILFLGCGKMGKIIVQNLISEKSCKPSQITVLKPTAQNKIDGISYIKNTTELVKNYHADIVFICIKPQEAKEVLKKFSQEKIFSEKTIFISILAGKKIEFFENIFGKKAKIIRSMPNLPIQDSQGIFTYFLNKNFTKSESQKLEKIFTKFGAILKLKDENLFDIATAIFGSGPAYIFLLQEIFSKIAIKNKISEEQANELVKTLFLGSTLMSCNSKLDFSQLRESVTSKGGTTQAALEVLQKNSALEKLLSTAISKAQDRSKNLSK